jgi:hypothetical protein
LGQQMANVLIYATWDFLDVVGEKKKIYWKKVCENSDEIKWLIFVIFFWVWIKSFVTDFWSLKI